jgi:hypothetical protein
MKTLMEDASDERVTPLAAGHGHGGEQRRWWHEATSSTGRHLEPLKKLRMVSMFSMTAF